MPQKSTCRSGAMTSASRLPAAAASSALLGRANDVAARLFVRLKFHKPFLFSFLQQIGERLEAVVGLVEAGLAPLQRLLDHRAPDLLALAAFGEQGGEGFEPQSARPPFLLPPPRAPHPPLPLPPPPPP